MNSLRRAQSQEPQINNAIFYLNSYLCEAKSSPEMTVLFISIGEKTEDTNHLAQRARLFAVFQHPAVGVRVCLSSGEGISACCASIEMLFVLVRE